MAWLLGVGWLLGKFMCRIDFVNLLKGCSKSNGYFKWIQIVVVAVGDHAGRLLRRFLSSTLC